jgi:hypothetical protein
MDLCDSDSVSKLVMILTTRNPSSPPDTNSTKGAAVDLQLPMQLVRDRCGRERIIVGITTTYAISAYHH